MGTAANAGGTGRKKRAYLTHERPLFFAHRGGAKLAPENTLAAFEKGVALGADALELDIQTTREGELVVIHDATVDRTTNGTGPVSTFTLAELRKLDAGYRFTPDEGQTFPFRGKGHSILTLSEVFERFPTLRVNIDLKESTAVRERRLWELIRKMRIEERVLVASGDLHEPILRFRHFSGGRVATSASEKEIRTFVLTHFARATRLLRPAYDALQVPEMHRGVRVVSASMVEAAHRLGLEVHVWTVDERETMERLLSWGVDGIMSDRPDVLAQVMTAAKE